MNEIITDHVIDFFTWYSLHDIPIDGLQFDFQTQTITLILDDCDRESQDVELRLVFKKVSKYTFEYPVEEFVFDMRAVYSTQIRKLEDNQYELEVLIDMPEIKKTYGKQREWVVGKMLIGFAEMEVIGGLSREAMEEKWRTEDE